MKNAMNGIGVVQNIGWLDRVVRVVGGALMIAIPIFLMSTETSTAAWMFYVILAAIYPLLTGIIGFDAFYKMLDVKSCGSSNRNPCGSFPYEVDAALGHNPISDSDIINELGHSHHAR